MPTVIIRAEAIPIAQILRGDQPSRCWLSIDPPPDSCMFLQQTHAAERWRSLAAGSGSDVGADAVGSQVQRFVGRQFLVTTQLQRRTPGQAGYTRHDYAAASRWLDCLEVLQRFRGAVHHWGR